jgi:hypothetical protein
MTKGDGRLKIEVSSAEEFQNLENPNINIPIQVLVQD